MKRKLGEAKPHYQHRLFMTRTHSVWAGQKESAKKLGLDFPLTVEQVREMVECALANTCPYCGEKITLKNFSLDHHQPASRGGSFAEENFKVICRRDNETKGKLTSNEYRDLLAVLKDFPDEARTDVLRRLRMGSKAIGRIFWGGKGKPDKVVANAVEA